MKPSAVRNQVQLITYPDSLGGDLPALYAALTGPLAGLCGGVHILPFYPSSGDRGFAPITYREVDPQFGTWDDIRRIGAEFDVAADLMVNHISRRSPYFQDFARRGRASKYADLFITLDKIWHDGSPSMSDVAHIALRRPKHPFTDITIEETGETERLWATFGKRDWVEQIDLDVNSPQTRVLLQAELHHLREQNIRIVRLDAVGYVIKKPGTSCFFVEPEIYAFLDWLRAYAEGIGLTLLSEVHAPFDTQRALADHGYPVYDFVLPFLTLYTLFTRSNRKLCDYLQVCPRQQFTTLDCHDGIPVQPDLDGLLTPEEATPVVEQLLARGANLTRLMTPPAAHPDFDAHQVNITYYSALNTDDDAYLIARAIQCFAPGTPQIYYVGLLAGENDAAAVVASGEGRAINRHNYTLDEIDASIQRPVVQRLFELIRFRNTYPAFNGTFSVLDTPEHELGLMWEYGAATSSGATCSAATCTLNVDLIAQTARISYHSTDGVWQVREI
ncbi:MAG: sucrose phosphorylase [Anaerolineae bacterium]|nr:sucrose phosphorylase [Anaerolineae bacterium]